MKGSRFLGGSRLKALGLVALLMASGVFVGCGDCGDEIAAARAFLESPDNLSCASNDDCVVVPTGCEDFARTHCGQGQLNREAAASSRWSELRADLSSCQSGTCSQCGALLSAQCSEGFCGGPP